MDKQEQSQSGAPAASTPPELTSAASTPLPTPGNTTPKPPSSPKKLLAGIVAALVIVAGLAFLFLSPASPLNGSKVPAGPKLLVGKQPYLYTCSLLDPQKVGSTFQFNTDKNELAIEESFAYAPADTKDKELELIKLIGAKNKADQTVSSDCTLKFDRQFAADETGKKQASFINVTVTADQYQSEKDAQEAFTKDRPQAAKTLGDLGDKGYFTPPATQSETSSVKYVTATFLHKNIIFTIEVPAKSSDTLGTQIAGQIASVAHTITQQVDAGKGTKPKQFSGANKVGDNPLLDPCNSVNYVKVAQAMGSGVELRATRILTDKSLASDDFDGTRPKTIEANCGFSFRTSDDAAAQAKAEKNLKSQAPPPLPGGDESSLDPSALSAAALANMTYEDKFPHLLDIRYFTTASKEDAQKLVQAVKKDVGSANGQGGAQYQIEDTKFGDGGIRVSTDTKAQSDAAAQAQGLQGEGSPSYYETRIYYTAKGPYVYMVTALFTRQVQPYPTTSFNLTDDHMKALSKELEAGIRRAEKQAR